MSPSARLIGYYIDNNERVVADSILLNIEDSLPSEVNKLANLESPLLKLLFNLNKSLLVIMKTWRKSGFLVNGWAQWTPFPL